jgi:hypothetical protein
LSGAAAANYTLTQPTGLTANITAAPTTLAVGASCVNTGGTTVAATQSLPAVACNGYTGNADDDVWYTFTLASASTVNITVEATNNVMDPVVQLFSGSCSTPTSITCADNSLRGGVERIVRNLSAGTNN